MEFHSAVVKKKFFKTHEANENVQGLDGTKKSLNLMRQINLTKKDPQQWRKLASLVPTKNARWIKALSHGAIFLAICNAILLLVDVKLANTRFHHSLLVYS